MPIELVAASRGGAEFEAALTLQRWLSEYAGPDDRITIVVGAKTEGERVEDIDLLVIGEMAPGTLLPDRSLPVGLRGRPVQLRDFVFTIEVKAHDPESIRVIGGNKIQVRYGNKWKSATDQANEQKYALKAWVERTLQIVCPRISHAVWLMNVPASAISKRPRHVLFSDSELPDLFALLDAGSLERAAARDGSAGQVSAIVGTDRSTVAQLQAYFQNKIQLGKLDRRKLERVCDRIVRDQLWTDRLGKQLLIFRGRGGAGKTLRLLNIARHLYKERGQRALFLTYNRALVQDVRRLTNVLGVSDGDLRIQTTDSFMLSLCEAFGQAPRRDAGKIDWVDYAARKQVVAQQLVQLGHEGIKASPAAAANPALFAWDVILIDEGQDWPPAEKAAIFAIFGHRKVIVADGVDQFVQTVRRCDWASGVDTGERQIVSLPKSLRLKANLCRFAKAFASELDLPDWSLDLDRELSGGQIKIFLRPYTKADHERIFRKHAEAGNQPIDALFCMSKARGSVHASLPDDLRAWGQDVWDGSLSQNRNHYPQDVSQLRVVQYQSCRGMEGWTVVCLDLDKFFEEQLRFAPKPESADMFIDRDMEARRHAARWCLIPFTRAIDTLVVHASEASQLGQVLLNVSKGYRDFVEVVR